MRLGQEPGTVFKPLIEMTDNETGCWRWLGKISKQTGYGCKETGGKTMLAHRWVYQIFKGYIPKDRNIDHLCRNRWCVNPQHLEAATQAVNCRRGAGTKLSEGQARQIKERLKTLKWGDRAALAVEFGVSPGLISDIKYGRAWIEIQP